MTRLEVLKLLQDFYQHRPNSDDVIENDRLSWSYLEYLINMEEEYADD